MENFYLVITYLKTLNGARTKHTYFDERKHAENYISRCKARKTYDGHKLLHYRYDMEPMSIETISIEL